MLTSKWDNMPTNSLYLVFNIYSQCNLKCSYCSAHSPDAEFNSMSNKTIKLISNILSNSERSFYITIEGGEPTLNKDFKEIYNILSTNEKILNIEILTNITNPDILINANVKSITASFHPEQMQPKLFIKHLKQLLDANIKVETKLLAYPNENSFNKIKEYLELTKDLDVFQRVGPIKNGNLYYNYSDYIEKYRDLFSNYNVFNKDTSIYNTINKECSHNVFEISGQLGDIKRSCLNDMKSRLLINRNYFNEYNNQCVTCPHYHCLCYGNNKKSNDEFFIDNLEYFKGLK